MKKRMKWFSGLLMGLVLTVPLSGVSAKTGELSEKENISDTYESSGKTF